MFILIGSIIAYTAFAVITFVLMMKHYWSLFLDDEGKPVTHRKYMQNYYRNLREPDTEHYVQATLAGVFWPFTVVGWLGNQLKIWVKFALMPKPHKLQREEKELREKERKARVGPYRKD